MRIIFNPLTGLFEVIPLVFSEVSSGSFIFGTGDLEVDTGLRTEDQSIVDGGDRVITTLT